jgi:hypothetical protein
VERLSASVARVSGVSVESLKCRLNGLFILENDSKVLQEMRDFIVEAWRLVERCTIYIFLQLEHFNLLRAVITTINTAADRADDYLFQDFPKKFQENYEFALYEYDEDFLSAERRVNE